jgi:hypothetical protein
MFFMMCSFHELVKKLFPQNQLAIAATPAVATTSTSTSTSTATTTSTSTARAAGGSHATACAVLASRLLGRQERHVGITALALTKAACLVAASVGLAVVAIKRIFSSRLLELGGLHRTGAQQQGTECNEPEPALWQAAGFVKGDAWCVHGVDLARRVLPGNVLYVSLRFVMFHRVSHRRSEVALAKLKR